MEGKIQEFPSCQINLKEKQKCGPNVESRRMEGTKR